jgi:hypothetical protein
MSVSNCQRFTIPVVHKLFVNNHSVEVYRFGQ